MKLFFFVCIFVFNVFVYFLFFFSFKQKTAYEILYVTGVQTCALPIWILHDRGRQEVRPAHVILVHRLEQSLDVGSLEAADIAGCLVDVLRRRTDEHESREALRSEERRVGKECRSRWAPGRYKKKRRN